jgi:hypothetical protein
MWGDMMSIKGMFNQKAQKKNPDGWEKQILRINTLEVQMKGILEFEKKVRTSMYRNSSGEKKENKQDEHLIHLIEQLISEKAAVHFQRDKQLDKKIEALENQISVLKDSLKVPYEEPSKIEHQCQTPSEDVSTTKHTREKRDEEEVLFTQIEKRVQLLEQNVLLVNEVQAVLLKRMEELTEKSNVLLKQISETEISMKNKEAFLQTLYIDKLYLEKYEQNHNFAQLGIKNLNGALNIGAMYGKDAIPKEITEQVKEEMANIKEMKEEMENIQPGTDEPEDLDHDESSSEGVSNPSEENIPFTDIIIEEDDPSFGGDSFNHEK